ncbi:tyrosine-protein phosphatase [soil metagenome]
MHTSVPEIPGVINLRDAGGYPTVDGRSVRRGVLYRSGQLNHEGDASMAALEGLGLGVVFDLRTQDEVDAIPDRLPAGVEAVHLDVLAGATSSVVAHMEDMFADPTSAEAVLRSGDVAQHYVATCRDLVTLESALSSYTVLFSQLASRDDVALFHCTAGKDRTGWAGASLLTLLGVEADTVMADYELSSKPVIASFQKYIDQFADAGGDPDLLTPVFSVEPDYLNAAFDQANIVFGSLEGYFRDGLGLGDDGIAALRNRLVA